jgi:hypothetical protein
MDCHREAEASYRALGEGQERDLIRSLIWQNYPLRELRRPKEAEEKLREAMRLIQEDGGPEHPWYANCCHYLALVLSHEGPSDEAYGYLEKSLAANRKRLPENHVWIARCLEIMAQEQVARAKFDRGGGAAGGGVRDPAAGRRGDRSGVAGRADLPRRPGQPARAIREGGGPLQLADRAQRADLGTDQPGRAPGAPEPGALRERSGAICRRAGHPGRDARDVPGGPGWGAPARRRPAPLAGQRVPELVGLRERGTPHPRVATRAREAAPA